MVSYRHLDPRQLDDLSANSLLKQIAGNETSAVIKMYTRYRCFSCDFGKKPEILNDTHLEFSDIALYERNFYRRVWMYVC